MVITNKSQLDLAIIELEKKKIVQEHLITAQLNEVRERLSPVNVIKDTFSQLTKAPDFRNGVLKTLTGFGVGVLSKRLFLGPSHSIIKKMLGSVFELAVAKSTISNADKLKAYGVSIYKNLFKNNNNHQHHDD